jgi:hypothetical protein
MYQPYPAGAQMPEVRPPTVPPSVANAVKVMYVGAAASVLGIIVDILTVSATKTAIEKRSPHLSVSQVNSTQHVLIGGFIVAGLIGAAAWIFIARSCRGGHSWARVTGTVLFAISTINTIAGVAAPEAVVVKVWAFVVWLVGLTAVYFLWQRSSSDFFNGIER